MVSMKVSKKAIMMLLAFLLITAFLSFTYYYHYHFDFGIGQTPADKVMSQGKFSGCVYKNALADPTKKLIRVTHFAHTNESVSNFSMKTLFAFLSNSLNEDDLNQIGNRGMVTLTQHEYIDHQGQFDNRGNTLVFNLSLRGDTIEVTIPSDLQGEYASGADHCKYAFSRTKRIKLTKYVFGYIPYSLYITRVECTDKTIKIIMSEQKYNLCYYFD